MRISDGSSDVCSSALSGIRVNAVLPGLVDTPLVAPVMNYEPARDMFLSRIPMSRAATPDEIAGPCLYLASADASYLTGTSLVVDGGWEVDRKSVGWGKSVWGRGTRGGRGDIKQ